MPIFAMRVEEIRCSRFYVRASNSGSLAIFAAIRASGGPALFSSNL
jgi:hypothetical protein